MARIITVLLLFTANCFAATYYLDASVGSSGNGTSWAEAKKTWAEINALLDALDDDGAGDIVDVNDGNYGSIGTTNTPVLYSTKTDWLTIKAATGKTPIFTYLKIYNNWEPSIDTYIKLQDITFDVASFNGTAVDLRHANYVYFDHCNFIGAGSTPLFETVGINACGIAIGDRCSNISIISCHFYGDGNDIETQWPGRLSESGISGVGYANSFKQAITSTSDGTLCYDNIIRDCNIHGCYTCISTAGSGWTIQNNDLHHFAADGIVLGTSNLPAWGTTEPIKIIGNTIRDGGDWECWISFENGSIEPSVNNYIRGATSNAKGKINAVVLDSGSWEEETAAGHFYMESWSITPTNGETGQTVADCNSAIVRETNWDSEAKRLTFISGSVEPTVSHTLWGDKSGSFGVVSSVALESGSWAAGNAAGYIDFSSYTGTPTASEWFSDWAGAINICTFTTPFYPSTSSHQDGIQFNHNAQNHIIISENKIYNIDGDAFFCRAEGNVDVTGQPNTDWLIENNLTYNILRMSGSRSKDQAARFYHCDDITLRNNTFADCGVTSERDGDCNYPTTWTSFHNNIMNRPIFAFYLILSENNNIINYSNSTAGHEWGSNTIILTSDTTFQALFKNFPTDLSPASADSLCVGHGDPENCPISDILGVLRDEAPDAGCYEYVAGGESSEDSDCPKSLRENRHLDNPLRRPRYSF